MSSSPGFHFLTKNSRPEISTTLLPHPQNVQAPGRSRPTPPNRIDDGKAAPFSIGKSIGNTSYTSWHFPYVCFPKAFGFLKSNLPAWLHIAIQPFPWGGRHGWFGSKYQVSDSAPTYDWCHVAMIPSCFFAPWQGLDFPKHVHKCALRQSYLPVRRA